MTPHKVCPHCGQPAVLEMPQCRRCGIVYLPSAAQPPPPFGRPLSAASQREVRPVSNAPRKPAAIAALLAILLLALGGAAIFRAASRITLPPARVTEGGARSVPRGGVGMRDPTAGLFVEHESRAEMPSLVITNGDNDTMYLELRDAAGRKHTLTARPNETAQLQIPAGQYGIAVTSDNPYIRPNYGDAVFRRFKEYAATFVTSSDPAPIHLGD